MGLACPCWLQSMASRRCHGWNMTLPQRRHVRIASSSWAPSINMSARRMRMTRLDRCSAAERLCLFQLILLDVAGFCWDYGSLRGWYWGHHLRTWRLGLRHWTALPTLLGLEMAWSAGGLAVAKAFNFHPCNSYEGYQIGTHCVGSLIVFAQLLSKPEFLQGGSGYIWI